MIALLRAVDHPNLIRWHRFVGWVTMILFVIHKLVYQINGVDPTRPFSAKNCVHAGLALVCATAVLSKIKVRWRTIALGRAQRISWLTTAFFVGACYTIWTGILGLWCWADPSLNLKYIVWPTYEVMIFGHIGMGFLLILVGRMVLADWAMRMRSLNRLTPKAPNHSGGIYEYT